MSGYVEAGYVVVLSTLSVYAVSLLARERVARKRLRRDVAPRAAVGLVEGPAPAAGDVLSRRSGDPAGASAPGVSP